MIAAQLTLSANVLTEVYTAEVFLAEALDVKVSLCNESAAHWVDIDVVIAHGATSSIIQDAPVMEVTAARRYFYRGHSMRPTETKHITLSLRHGDTVLVKASTANLSCTVLAEETVTPRALQAVEDRLDALVEDMLNQRAIAEATTGEEAVARSNTRLVRYTLFLDVLVDATAAITSPSISLEYATQVESVFLRARSVAGTADVKLEYAQSWDGTEYDSFDDTMDITSSTNTDRPGNAEGFNTYTMPTTIGNRYIQIRATGTATNAADTLVTGYLIMREGYA